MTSPDAADNTAQDGAAVADENSGPSPDAPADADPSAPVGPLDRDPPEDEFDEDWTGGGPGSGHPQQNDPEGESAGSPNGAENVAEAIDFVARQFCAAAAVFSTYAELGDPRLDLGPDRVVEWGTCPEVRIASSAEVSLISFHFPGCAAPCVAHEVVAGDSGHIVWHPPWDATVHVTDDFTIAGRTIVPLYDHPRLETEMPVVMAATMIVGGGGVALTGPCDFRTQGVGRATGELWLHVQPGYTLTFVSAELLFAGADAEKLTSLADVRIRPAQYANFVPDAGSATFDVELGGVHTVVVTFLGTSPQNGIVMVSIDGGAATPHELPGELW